MADYKGVYYQDDNEQKYYEGGAHFKYSDLCKILEILFKEQQTKIKANELLSKNIRKINNSKKDKKDNQYCINKSKVVRFILFIYLL